MARELVDWELVTLGELGQFRNGVNFSQDDYGPGLPIINVKQLYGGRYVQTRELLQLRASAVRNAELVQLNPGDILFARSSVKASGAGQVAMVGACPPGTVFSGFIIRYRVEASERASPSFLNYALRSPTYRELLTRIASGTTITNLSQETLAGIELDLPPLPEQHAIAHTLGTLDDKIELNRRMNETLEAMARALFQSWFVDFDPVRAKAEGRDPGLPQHLADLFPDSFEDSELGEIPRGWQVTPVRHLTSNLSRGIGPAYTDDGGICVLNQKCIRDRRIDFSKARRHDPGRRNVDNRLLQRLDILVNSTGVGTLGRAAQLLTLPEPAIVDSHVSVIRAAPDVNPWFLGVGLTSRESEIEALGEGSTGQTELSRVRLGELACVVPPPKLQQQFGSMAEQLLQRLASNQEESASLATLRDTLLPKLISGELRVPEAERYLEGVVA